MNQVHVVPRMRNAKVICQHVASIRHAHVNCEHAIYESYPLGLEHATGRRSAFLPIFTTVAESTRSCSWVALLSLPATTKSKSPLDGT